MRILLLLLLCAGRLTASEIEFIPNDISAARARAQREGKLLIVKFYADWCASCSIMDKSTWVDPKVVDYVASNCIAAKIDYKNNDGISYFQFFNVEKLPTILLLDACGNEIGRYENAATPKQLIRWVNTYNSSEFRNCEDGNSSALPVPLGNTATAISKPTPTVSSGFPAPINPENEGTRAQMPSVAAVQDSSKKKKRMFSVIKKKKMMVEPPKYDEDDPSDPGHEPEPISSNAASEHYDATLEKRERIDYFPPKPQSAAKPTITVPIAYGPNNNMPEQKKTMSNVLSTNSSRIKWESEDGGFSIQVFASTSQEGALEIKEKCLAQFKKPVAIIEPSVDGGSYYRVVVGQFGSKADAERFKPTVKSLYSDAFVKGF